MGMRKSALVVDTLIRTIAIPLDSVLLLLLLSTGSAVACGGLIRRKHVEDWNCYCCWWGMDSILEGHLSSFVAFDSLIGAIELD